MRSSSSSFDIARGRFSTSTEKELESLGREVDLRRPAADLALDRVKNALAELDAHDWHSDKSQEIQRRLKTSLRRLRDRDG